MIPTILTFGSIALLGGTASKVFELAHRHDLAKVMNVLTKGSLMTGAAWQGWELFGVLSMFM